MPPPLARRTRAAASLLLAVACACGDAPATTAGPGPSTAQGPLVPAEPFGTTAGERGTACRAAERRQFDFWLGEWSVRTPTAPAAVPNSPSVISTAVGGCAVLENWINGSGRSVSAYDAATGRWTQHYVFASGGTSLLAGTFRGDSMVLESQRIPAAMGTVWVWTAVTRDSVRQHQMVVRNGVRADAFDGRYRRVTQAPAPPLPANAACQGAAFRALDFLLGDWDVHLAPTAAPAGRLGVHAASNGCLLEESLQGADGYAGLAYTSYHPQLQAWFRTYVDDEGRYLLLEGTVTGTRAVLTGERPGASGQAVRVRVTWDATSATRVTQRWESSRDAGATWRVDAEYTLAKR